MSTTKFTPGPWEIMDAIRDVPIGGAPHTAYPIVTAWDDQDKERIGIAICILPNVDHSNNNEEYMQANQRLIAAAPALYEALNELVQWYAYHEQLSFIPAPYLSTAAGALKKAQP